VQGKLEEFDHLIKILKETATDSHVLGISTILLYIGKKRRK
jgi:hypothetical protein